MRVPAAPLVEAKGVEHTFPDGTRALKGVDLRIRPGEFLLLAGRNGSGKTILMHHLNGLMRPTAGTVLFKGEPLQDQLREGRRQIGLVFQNSDSQLIEQTVARDIAFGPGNLKWGKERIRNAVEKAMNENHVAHLAQRIPFTLSGGEKKRCAIAGITVLEPALIIFDEPFTGLDYPSVKRLIRHILHLKESGHAILLITHDPAKTAAHADRLAVMEEGRLYLDAPISSLAGDQGLRKTLREKGLRIPLTTPLEEMTWLT